MTKIRDGPDGLVRAEKAINLPLGDQAGFRSANWVVVSRMRPLPFAFIKNKSGFRVCLTRRANAISEPSGDQAGSRS
jgi:hypothetical protein